METYKVVDDSTHTVLREGIFNAWEYAYNVIKETNSMEIYIEVFEDGSFSHWVDSESIVTYYERR